MDDARAIAWLLGLALVVAATWAGPALLARWRNVGLLRQPFPPAWRAVLRQRMPAYRTLPADLQLQIRQHVRRMLADVPFIGCDGLVVTDEMRVLVAAQAALLLLNRRRGRFRSLRQVLLYPAPFIVERTVGLEGGLHEAQRRVLAGESWQLGQVILSWPDVLAGAAIPDDGRNVVIHEFAHQLDQETGTTNGAPFVTGNAARQRWASTMSAEFAALQLRLARGEVGLMDAYAATSPAEFFAVASEVFFEQPQALARTHPALFRELLACYRTNPLAW